MSTLTVEKLNDTAANRRNDVSLKLDHIQATLDLLRVISMSHDPDGDLSALCAGTLVNVPDGLMREVAEVQAYVDNLHFEEGSE
jgi:hypothetical protein